LKEEYWIWGKHAERPRILHAMIRVADLDRLWIELAVFERSLDSIQKGDIVEIRTPANPILGRVEWLTLRATALRAYDGTLHIVPNGNIVLVSNNSRGWARAIVDTHIAYGQDPEQVRGVLDELFDEFRDELRKDAEMKAWVMDGPSVLGVETTNDRDVGNRVGAETKPSKKVDVERILRARITQRLSERGIRAPVLAAPPPAVPEA